MVRLAARHRTAKLSMPSVLGDDLWLVLVLHTRDYAGSCQAAFGRFLTHTPASVSAAVAAANSAHDGRIWVVGAVSCMRRVNDEDGRVV